MTYLNAPLLFLPSSQRQAVADLVAAMDGSQPVVSLIGESGAGKTSALDRLAMELEGQGARVLRVAAAASSGPASPGLDLPGLVAQLVGRSGGDALQDEDLERAFDALTEPDEAAGRIALLVDDAPALLPAAVRYLGFSCRSGPALRVVLAGPPGMLDGAELATLRGDTGHDVRLPALTDNEAGAFAGHLLRSGGMPARHAIASDAHDALVGHGCGNPGRIAALLRGALVLAVARGEAPVLRPTIEQAAAALDGRPVPASMPEPATRPVAPPPPAMQLLETQIVLRATPAFRPGPARRSAPARRRRELTWALGGLGLGASLALAAGALWLPGFLPPPSTVAEAPVVGEPRRIAGDAASGVDTPAVPTTAAPIAVSGAAPNAVVPPPAAELDVAGLHGARLPMPAGGASVATPAPADSAPGTVAPPVLAGLAPAADGTTAGGPDLDIPLPPKPPASPADPVALPAPQARPSAVARAMPEAARPLARVPRAASERVVAADIRADERRCRDIVLKAQLEENLTNADRQFLRSGCRSGG